MQAEPFDMTALAVLVRRDRAGLNLNQTDYGHRLGLSQAQISDLECARFLELSHDMQRALARRFKRLPTVQPTAERDRLIQDVLQAVARELGSVFGVIPGPERVELANHLKRQVALLAGLARRAARAPKRRPPRENPTTALA
jgi:transcriptional regulator with XRE-family HTH domain